jgi:hypothetical protein
MTSLFVVLLLNFLLYLDRSGEQETTTQKIYLTLPQSLHLYSYTPGIRGNIVYSIF